VCAPSPGRPVSIITHNSYIMMNYDPSLGYLNPVLKILLALGMGLAICALL